MIDNIFELTQVPRDQSGGKTLLSPSKRALKPKEGGGSVRSRIISPTKGAAHVPVAVQDAWDTQQLYLTSASCVVPRHCPCPDWCIYAAASNAAVSSPRNLNASFRFTAASESTIRGEDSSASHNVVDLVEVDMVVFTFTVPLESFRAVALALFDKSIRAIAVRAISNFVWCRCCDCCCCCGC